MIVSTYSITEIIYATSVFPELNQDYKLIPGARLPSHLSSPSPLLLWPRLLVAPIRVVRSYCLQLYFLVGRPICSCAIVFLVEKVRLRLRFRGSVGKERGG